jgi:hypothetical protein
MTTKAAVAPYNKLKGPNDGYNVVHQEKLKCTNEQLGSQWFTMNPTMLNSV